MSFENDPRLPEQPTANIEPPRSKKKIWLFGGCGCLSLLALICIAGGLATYFLGLKPMNDFTKQTETLIRESSQVQSKLGPQVTTEKSVPAGSSESDMMEFRTPVRGSKGTGTVVTTARMQPKDGRIQWTRESMVLEFDGEKIEIDPDAELIPDLDINDGNQPRPNRGVR